MRSLGIVLMGTVMVLGTGALAEDAPAASGCAGGKGCGCGGPGDHGDRAAMVKEFDKDGDGKLSDEEKAAMPKREHRRHGDRGKRPAAEPDTE